MKRQELESRGLDRAAATAATRRTLGNLLLTRDHVRDVWIAPWLQGMLQDYRLGQRMLLKYPGLTFAGGLALATAIGIGPTSVLHALVDLAGRQRDHALVAGRRGLGPVLGDGAGKR